MRSGIFRRRNFVSMFFLIVMMAGISVSPMLTQAAGAPSGIKGNGTGGIYININEAPFTEYGNKKGGDVAYGNMGCTWYVAARVNQLTGKDVAINGGNTWYNSSNGTGFPKGQDLKAPAVLCWSGVNGGWGHVAILEKIEGDTAYISEGGSGASDASHGYCILRACSLSNVKKCTGKVFKGLVYLPGASETQPQPQPQESISISGAYADGITETNAIVRATCNKSPSVKMESCGIYLGTDAGNLTKRNTEGVTAGANAKNNGTSFDIWYDLTGELGITLSPGTTYYYQFYCTHGGNEYRGDVCSFTTSNDEVSQKIKVKVPANHLLQCYQYVGSNVKYRKVDPQSKEYSVMCSKYKDHNGTRWFFWTDASGNTMWFPYDSACEYLYYPEKIIIETNSLTLSVGGGKQRIRYKVYPDNFSGQIDVANTACFMNYTVYKDYIEVEAYSILQSPPKIYLYATLEGRTVLRSTDTDSNNCVNVTVVDDEPPVIDEESIQMTETEKGFDITWREQDNYALQGRNKTVKVWNSLEGEDGATAYPCELYEALDNQNGIYSGRFKCSIDRANHASPDSAATYYFLISASDNFGNTSFAYKSYDVREREGRPSDGREDAGSTDGPDDDQEKGGADTPGNTDGQGASEGKGKINIAKAKISGVNASYVYTGRQIVPSPVLSISGKTLVRNVDYILKYNYNVNVGLAWIDIYGKGNYDGEWIKSFRIVKANNPLYLKTASKSFWRSDLKKAKYFSIKSSKGKGSITYKLNSSGKKAGISVSGKGRVRIPKKCKRGTYKITVKAGGNGNYKSASRNFTIWVI